MSEQAVGFGTPKFKNTYRVECYENYHKVPDWVPLIGGAKICKRLKPKLKWIDGFTNLVVTAGLNKVLDATFKTGLASPAWYVGLKNTGTPLAADTMASHSSWTENATYSNANRPTWTPGSIAAGSVDDSASKAIFNINGTTTIFGCFLCDNNTVSGSTGTLYGVGDFGASRGVSSGDTLNVTVTLTQS